jgi:NMD protein affecting ribosome stability and mRNA decay
MPSTQLVNRLPTNEVDACSECGQPADNGEGWNGLCGSCADRMENELEDNRSSLA